MSLWKIAWRSIQQRSLASLLTAASMGLSVALVVTILIFFAVVEQSFRRGGEGYDLLVGAKGDRLQLVLNSVYFLSEPLGNIPESYYEEFVDGQFAPEIEAVIPICMGHSYGSFRVIGTVPEMFTELVYYVGDDEKQYEFVQGENFKTENPFDAVIGATVAKETGMKVGEKFRAKHGVGEGAKDHDLQFNIVGVLAHTGTPNDRGLFVNREGFYTIHDDEKAAKEDHGHDHAHEDEHGHKHEAGERAVTALLVCVDEYKPTMFQVVQRKINEGSVAQAVAPAAEIDKLFEGIVGDVQSVLLIMAVLVVVVAGMGIMVSIYSSMNDRRHEIAVMRALGAGRRTVMVVILLESVLLSLGGGVLGLLLGHGLITALSPVIVEQTGVAVSLLHFRPIELVLIPGLVALAAIVGYLPAVAAYRTDVARSLTANP